MVKMNRNKLRKDHQNPQDETQGLFSLFQKKVYKLKKKRKEKKEKKTVRKEN